MLSAFFSYQLPYLIQNIEQIYLLQKKLALSWLKTEVFFKTHTNQSQILNKGYAENKAPNNSCRKTLK